MDVLGLPDIDFPGERRQQIVIIRGTLHRQRCSRRFQTLFPFWMHGDFVSYGPDHGIAAARDLKCQCSTFADDREQSNDQRLVIGQPMKSCIGKEKIDGLRWIPGGQIGEFP